MDFYLEEDYKRAIRQRVKELAKKRPSFTLKSVAQSIPIQYTYFSRVLNDPSIHLSEDHLFAVGEFLDFIPDEMEYLQLLRASVTTQSHSRREFVQKKLNHIRQSRTLHATVQEGKSSLLNKDLSYLLDPWSVLVHVALHIPRYQSDPRKLCPILGISPERLSEDLKNLQTLGFITLSESGRSIETIKNAHMHYSSDHPLMRVHQQLLRDLSAAQALKLDEQDKFSFQVLFSAQPSTFLEIKKAFKEFIQKVENLSVDAPAMNMYQLSFDLLKWA